MLRFGLIALYIMSVTVCATAQQAAPAAQPTQVSAEPERVKVYGVGSEVTLPVLLPLSPVLPSDEKCKEHVDGRVLLSLFVDTTGHARNIIIIDPLGTEIDRFALRVAGADRFTPGSLDGKPVVVAASLEVKIASCLVEAEDAAGKKFYSLKLKSTPIQALALLTNPPAETVLSTDVATPISGQGVFSKSAPVGERVSAPVVIHQPPAEYTDDAIRKRIEGACLLSLIVDVQGMPQDVQVKRSLDPGLDETAVAAVYKFRFKPAMRGGEPVAVRVNVEINFRLGSRKHD